MLSSVFEQKEVIDLFSKVVHNPRYYDKKKKYNMNIFMSNEAEKVKEIQKISEQEVTFDECVQKAITSRKELIAQMENEITERLKSRAFKLGVKLTPKKERIDINDVLPPLEKKN